MATVLTTIPVTPEVRDRLKRLASKGETYDALLRRLLRDAEARLLYEQALHVAHGARTKEGFAPAPPASHASPWL